MSITAMLQKFRGRGLKTDAAPQAPRPQEQPTVNNNLDPESSFDTQYEYHEEYKEPKEKNKFFDTNKKSKPDTKEPKRSSSPSSPINVQAVGNVYNIVNASHIQVGHTINLSSPTGATGVQEHDLEQEEQVDITPAISALLAAQIKPKEKYLDYISKNLGRKWRSFFRSIGYNQRQIDTFMEKESNNVSEVIYQLLLDWKQYTDECLGALATALWEHGHRCLVCELADIYAKAT